MKTRISFALLLLLVLGTGIGGGQSENQDPFFRLLGNGLWWTKLPPNAKVNFVDGYTTAMAKVNHTAHGLCMALAKDSKNMDQLMGSDNLCEIAREFDFGVDKEKLVDGLDDFYTDSQNTRLPIDIAMEYERDKLKGDTAPNELLKKLEGWRKIVNK